MIQLDLGSLALGWIASYGSPMVAILLFVGSLGIPLPGTLIVVASGAFIRQELLDALSTPLLGYLGTVSGDLALYAVGYFASAKIENRFGQTSTWKSARSLFERQGGLAIFLTRWLLTALAFPVTLIAGSSRYRFQKFALFDFLGELTWFVVYGGLGYAFGSQWELISQFLSDFSGFALGGLVLGIGLYLLSRPGRKQLSPQTET
jgi:membrane protein DedA with SNARE-associated domain